MWGKKLSALKDLFWTTKLFYVITLRFKRRGLSYITFMIVVKDKIVEKKNIQKAFLSDNTENYLFVSFEYIQVLVLIEHLRKV